MLAGEWVASDESSLVGEEVLPALFRNVGDDLAVWDLRHDREHTLHGLKLASADKFTLSRSGDSALVQKDAMGGVEIWDMTEEKRRALLKSQHGVISVMFGLDDTLIVALDNQGTTWLYDPDDGRQLVELTSITRNGPLAYYDRSLHRIHSWDDLGRVTRYTEGRCYFGRFVPTVSQATTK